MEAQLKAYITAGNVEPAINAMKAIEQAGGAGGRAQLYFKLGKLLEKELDRLNAQGNMAALSRTRQSYKAFLTTLAASKTEQTYDSLQWAGEGLITLGAYADAEKVLRRVLNEYTQDPQFLQQAGGKGRLLRTKLKLAAALQGAGRFDEANSILDELMSQKPPYIETLFEKGLFLEAEADSGHGTWSAAAPLGGSCQEDGAHSPSSGSLFRCLVPPRVGPLQGESTNKGTPDAPGNYATFAHGRQSRDEGQVSSPDCEAQVKSKDKKMACHFRGGALGLDSRGYLYGQHDRRYPGG